MQLKKYISKKRILLALILLLLILVFYRRSQSGIEVEITYPEKGTISQTIQAAGETDARERVDMSFLAGGQVAFVGVKKGDYVNKGDLIASLDKTSLVATLNQAQSDLRSAEATLERVYDDIKDNDTAESFTEKETRTTAEVAKDKAFDAVKKAQDALNNANLVSPVSGYVASISDSFYANNFVGPTDIITIVNPETIYFEIEVNEIDIPNAYLNQEAVISLDAYPDTKIPSSVHDISFVSTNTSTGGTAYEVDLDLPKDNRSYFLGMSGDAELKIEEKSNITIVPISAIVEEADKSFLWIIENGRAKQIEVTTGISSLNDVEIVKGDIDGREIIVRPPIDIVEGVRVIAS